MDFSPANIVESWDACEQPLTLLALYLHLDHLKTAKALPSTPMTSVDQICFYAIFYYKRLVGGDPWALRGEVFNWIIGEFIEASLEEFEKCSLPPLPQFWKYAKTARPDSSLSDHAIALFSIAVDTATYERYFGELALVHTPRRNHKTSEKAK